MGFRLVLDPSCAAKIIQSVLGGWNRSVRTAESMYPAVRDVVTEIRTVSAYRAFI